MGSRKKPSRPMPDVTDAMEAAERIAKIISLTMPEETLVTTSSSVSVAPPPISSSSFDEALETLIKEIVLKVLEDESVLVAIAGKAKKFSREAIAISKSDPRPEDVVVEEPPKPEPKEEGPSFLDELRNL